MGQQLCNPAAPEETPEVKVYPANDAGTLGTVGVGRLAHRSDLLFPIGKFES